MWRRIWYFKKGWSSITSQGFFRTVCKHFILEVVTTNAYVLIQVVRVFLHEIKSSCVDGPFFRPVFNVMSTIPFNIQFISNKRTCSKQKLTLLRVWENEKNKSPDFFVCCYGSWEPSTNKCLFCVFSSLTFHSRPCFPRKYFDNSYIKQFFIFFLAFFLYSF